MALVRKANNADIHALLGFGKKFVDYGYPGIGYPGDETMKSVLLNVMQHGVILVADLDGKIIGTIAGCLSSAWFNPSVTVAVEMAWWVDVEHRGATAAIRLIQAFVEWGKENGAASVCLSDVLPSGKETGAGKILERLGFRVAERTFTKEI